MKAAEMVTVGVPRLENLSGCAVPDLRECLDRSRRARAVLDAFDVQVARLLHEPAVRTGRDARWTQHENGRPSPECSKTSKNSDSHSPLPTDLFPHSCMSNVDVRGVSVATCGVVSRVAWSPTCASGLPTRFLNSSILGTDVSHEICPTVPHPLSMVEARLRSFRSASFRNGSSGCLFFSCVGGGA